MKGWTFLTMFSLVLYCQGVSIDQDLTLTSFQKSALDKLKELVEPYLPKDYMNEEIYLIRWLRARDFNVDAAKEMLMQNLEWRKENRMDEILNENWKDFEQDYKHLIQGVDKQGRPIIKTEVGAWDIRSAMVTGQRLKLLRLMDKGFEEITSIVRKFQREGKNVTQFYHIYNLDGYNLIQHSCPQCIGAVLHALSTYEHHYPGSAHKSVLINTPGIFEPLLQTLRMAMSPQLQEVVHVFGRNKKEWQAFLFKDISKSELSRELGGSSILQSWSPVDEIQHSLLIVNQ